MPLAEAPAAPEPDRLGWPLSLRNARRILVQASPDLLHESRPDETLDLVHAVIAVAHWHRFVIKSECTKRMDAYYGNPDTPRRIAEEIGLLSYSAMSSGVAVPRRWVTGFALVRYGRRPGVTGGIGPLGLEHWPLPNLSLQRNSVALSGRLEAQSDEEYVTPRSGT